jgi:hypothetical protein
MRDMGEGPGDETAVDAAAARNLRRLARLVTALTAVMIVGIVAVVGLMLVRLTRTPPPMLPASVSLPDGASARAVTVGEGWFLVVTDRDEILIFDRTTGALRQRVQLAPD